MKKVIKYEKDWLSFRTELEKYLTDKTISDNDDFLKYCNSWGVPPDRAVKFLTQ